MKKVLKESKDINTIALIQSPSAGQKGAKTSAEKKNVKFQECNAKAEVKLREISSLYGLFNY